MRILQLSLLVMVFFVLGIGAVFAEEQVNNTPSNTQALLEKAFQELKQADQDLTDIYEQILEKHKDDKAFVEKFTKAQMAWVAFRNAELEAIFPAQDKKTYGSTYSLAYAQEKSRLILERATQLNQWLTGLPKGTINAGSRGVSKTN